MSLNSFLDFLAKNEVQSTAEAELARVCEELQTNKLEDAALPTPPAETQPPIEKQNVVKPEDNKDNDKPTDVGVLTSVGGVVIIDDEHCLKMNQQTFSVDKFVKGKRVRYSYDEIRGVRKNVIVLEFLSEKPEAPKTVVAKTDDSWETPEASPAPLPTPAAAAAPPPLRQTVPEPAIDGQVQWQGIVSSVRSNDGINTLQVRFDNRPDDHTMVITDQICNYTPVEFDVIVAYCTVDNNDEDDDDDDQLVSVDKIIPLMEETRGGHIRFLYDGYGVIEDDVYFTTIEEDYAVGDYVEFTCVCCKKNDFNWRCLSTKKTEKPDRNSVLVTNREYVENEANFVERNGITIVNRDELNFRMYTVEQTIEKKIIIRNNNNVPWRLLNLFTFSCKTRIAQIQQKNYHKAVTINANSQVEVILLARAKFICNYEEHIICIFNKMDTVLVVPVNIAVGTDSIIKSVNSREMGFQIPKFLPREKPADPSAQVYRVTRTKRKFVQVRIGSYKIPNEILEFMYGEPKEFEAKCVEEYPYLAEELSGFNYKERLHQMIYISEAYLKKCFHVYDLKDLKFEKDGKWFKLPLQNLAECRPSVLQEDTVVATHGNTVFTGIIKKILQSCVLFEFHEHFGEDMEEKRYNVSFRYNRGPFMKLHHAVDEFTKKYGEEFLFPETVEERQPLIDVRFDCPDEETDPEKIQGPMIYHSPAGEVKEVQWVNPELNVHQKKAIVNALRGECRPLPHLICGPPGTGKTSTLVELILQQFQNDKQSHILVCTPSNSAADLIMDKLVKSGILLPDHFIRAVGFQVKEQELIPQDLLSYSGTVEKSKEGTEGREMTILENGFREGCQMNYLCDFRIIVVTVGSVATFMEMGFPEGHFTHLFVDEAGQCLESEILVPMTLLTKANGHFVFVGDEKQLGPVVQFNALTKWDYGLSLFERLQKFPMYNRMDQENYDSRLCYQLVSNYRALPTLLYTYNHLFYNNTLKPTILDESEVEYECLRSVMPLFNSAPYRTKDASVFFMSVKTDCRRTAINPSWINPGECDEVARFYKNLRDLGVSEMDVGIISPYQEQVRVIRSAIESVYGKELPKIGSVEEFQGQERMIILISTVRSKKRGEDKQFGLGFVNHPKRINVALSRARALLVIFGNPLIIGEDPNWMQVLRNCKKQMCYQETIPEITKRK